MTAAAATVDNRPEWATRAVPQRHERRSVSYCDIWDLVAPGEHCPACDDDFRDRLARASR